VYAPLPALLPFSKNILEVVLCEGRSCLNHFIIVKMAVFHSYRQSGKLKNLRGRSQASRVGEGQQSLFLVKNALVKTEVWDGALS
jgi:hypothetical protein